MRTFSLLLLFLLPLQLSAQVTLEDKIGQMIMVGFGTSQTATDSLQYDLQNRNLGGLLFFGYNLRFPSQIKAQNNRLKGYAETPPFFAIDQEGGIVARLDENNGFEETYTAYDLGYVFDSVDSTKAQAALMATWLDEYGFNLNLAPVVDLNINPDSPAIGGLERSYSDSARKVYEHASVFIEEFGKMNIAAALKHYPGHGSAVDDSHQGFTDITNTWQEKELDPYRMLIEDGYNDMVMTGHLFNQDWDNQYPASLSHYAITSMLRDSLGFNGVVISDELFMGAIQDNYGMDEAIVSAINAGTDILLFSTNIYNERSLPGYVIKLVKQKVEEGVISEATIQAAFERIWDLKLDKTITSTEWEPAADLPTGIRLGNYPNPFNPSTNVMITLMESREVQIQVMNTLGQVVQDWGKNKLSAGVHTFRFSGNRLASGMYFVTVRTGGQLVTHKMLLMK